jgi:ribosomal protein S18 acetylase RimI-like enzyme
METVINGRMILLRSLNPQDINLLNDYLMNLSDQTKCRFGPHSFDRDTLSDLFSNREDILGYISLDKNTGKIIAYSILKRGFLEHDRPRLESYGLTLNALTDITFAPSVSDEWQGHGVGTRLFNLILEELKSRNINRIILWGGVQCSNHLAVHYYQKLGFEILGEFEYYGRNYDMLKLVQA